MTGKSYRRRLRALSLYLCYVFWALINSLCVDLPVLRSRCGNWDVTLKFAKAASASCWKTGVTLKFAKAASTRCWAFEEGVSSSVREKSDLKWLSGSPVTYLLLASDVGLRTPVAHRVLFFVISLLEILQFTICLVHRLFFCLLFKKKIKHLFFYPFIIIKALQVWCQDLAEHVFLPSKCACFDWMMSTRQVLEETPRVCFFCCEVLLLFLLLFFLLWQIYFAIYSKKLQ